MVQTYIANFDITTERELRAAMLRNDKIELTPPKGTDIGSVDCTAYVVNNQWLRLIFTGAEYSYYFDNTQGWYYISNSELASDINQQIASLKTELDQKEDKSESVVIDDGNDITMSIYPDKEYIFTGAVTNLNLQLNTLELEKTYATTHYHFAFESPHDSDLELTITPAVIMPDNFRIVRGRYYEVDILRNYAIVNDWEAR